MHRDGGDARRDGGEKNLKRHERENRRGTGRSDEQRGDKVEGRKKKEFM